MGRIPEGELGALAEHLACCDTCRRYVETVPADHLVSLVRQGAVAASRPARLSLRPGYELLERIGRGGMGVVYKARQSGLDRLVALKYLKHGDPGDEQELARFRDEAAAMARLAHPNIVRVYEVGEQEGRPYIACEYVAGGGLDRLLTGRALPVKSACRLVATLARAMHAAHQRGLVHRDLKPSNILLDGIRSGETGPEDDLFWEAVVPKIADFGLAKHLGNSQGLTQTGELLGTPEYMAPEQAGGLESAIGPATDVYALGVVLYELVTGRRPLQGASIAQTLELVRSFDPPAPARSSPRLPRDVDVICLKCLEKSPARRYAAAALLADDLERFLEGRPILARAPSNFERLGKWARRNPGWAALVVVGLGAVASLTAGTAWHLQRLEKEVLRATAAESQALARVRDGYDALEQLIRELPHGHPDTPAWRALDARIKDQALDYYYRVLEGADESNPRVRLAQGMLLTYAGSIHNTRRRYDLALRDLLRGLQQLESVRGDPQIADEVRSHLSNCEYNIAVAQVETGPTDETERRLERSISLLRGAEGHLDDSARTASRLALRFEMQWRMFQARSEPAAAQAALAQAVTCRERARQISPADEQNAVQLADDLTLLATAEILAGSLQPGEKRLGEAESVLRTLPGFELSLDAHLALIRNQAMWAVLEMERGNVDAALARHDEGIAIATAALAREPQDLRLRAELHGLYRAQAYILCRHGRAEESFPVWDRALTVVPAEHRDFCRVERALELAIVGRDVEAVAEAREVNTHPDLSNDTLMHLGRVFSRAIEAVQREAAADGADRAGPIDAYAAEGVDCLRRLPESHWSQPRQMTDLETDPAFAALRGQPAFAAWRQESGPATAAPE